MSDRRAATTPPSVWTAAFVGVATVFTIVALRFAIGQSVWTDESTQLSGLSLNFTEQLRWLAGRLPHAFPLPADRMPPLSYWLGSIWSFAFGGSPLSLRCLSVCLSIAAVVTLWTIARQYLDRRVALVCAALLAFSPNFIIEAAEIRAYAAFIFFSALLIHAYLRLLAARPDPSGADLWRFSIAAALCSYTHFFGIVLSAGTFFCALAFYLPVDSRAQGVEIVRRARWPLALYLASVVALVPLILAASRLSGGSDVGTAAAVLPFSARTHELARLVYRFFSHQSMLGIPGLTAAAMLAGLALLVFAAIPGSDQRARELLLLLLVTLALVVIAGFTTSAFQAFSPSYNVWVLPVTALLGGTALLHRIRSIRVAGAVCIGVLLATDCYAALRLSTAGEFYGHTRSSVMKTTIDGAGLGNVVVVYVNDAPSLYFAMMYDYNDRLPQYVAEGSALRLVGPPVGGSSSSLCDLNSETLLIADDEQLSAEALQFQITHPEAHTRAFSSLSQYLETHRDELAARWTFASQNEYLAQSTLALAIFKRQTAGNSPRSTSCH